MRLPALALMLHLAQATVPGDPRQEAPIWYAFMAEQFSRTDGATALYESTRRQAGRPSRAAGGT